MSKESDLLRDWKRLTGADKDEEREVLAKRNELAAGLHARLKVANLMQRPLSGISTGYAMRFLEGMERLNAAKPKRVEVRQADVPTAGKPWKIPWDEEAQAEYAKLPEHDLDQEPDWELPGQVVYPDSPPTLDSIYGSPEVEEPEEEEPAKPVRKRDPHLLRRKANAG